MSNIGLTDNFLLPGPVKTIAKLCSLLTTSAFWPDILATLMRVAVAFIISVLIGLPAGLLLGSSKKIYRSVEFLVDFFRSLPATALFPLFMLTFGVRDESKIAAATFASVLIIIFNTAYGVLHASDARVLSAKIMGATKIQIFSKILFWETLPNTLVGLRNAVSLSLVVIIVTEMFIGTTAGIGKKLIDFQLTYDLPAMYASIILIGLIGYCLNVLFLILEKKVVHWSGK